MRDPDQMGGAFVAMIFEELGDMLQFPEALREKDGLRLAQGLRGGAEAKLRDVLGAGQARMQTSTGVTMQKKSDSDGFMIRFSGKGVSDEMIKMVMEEVQKTLEK
ncbi:hypothetical protein [Sulfitobacter geojensis]|uniref:hypothetical protein n=1 Tax=Sulfitobacter geojensis TaxID=1342299 RepID=UPI00046A91DA|nr:hypothetical protein [Sulfitobacter geojensis]KHA54282.1 hypothetical protein Z947_50 [Sulfitobacter geojensis]NYI30180.1 hypothetical protein [Sulfitobacter geojensis]